MFELAGLAVVIVLAQASSHVLGRDQITALNTALNGLSVWLLVAAAAKFRRVILPALDRLEKLGDVVEKATTPGGRREIDPPERRHEP